MALSIVEAVQAKKDVYLTLRVPADFKKELRAAALKRRRSLNWLAQDILERWLAKQRKR